MHAPQHKTKQKREFLQVRGRLSAQQCEKQHNACTSAQNKTEERILAGAWQVVCTAM
jgi:hypothetical protein